MGTCWAFSPRRAADKAFSAQSPPTWYFNFERPTCKGAYRWRFEITIETMKGKGPCLPLIKMVEQALCLFFLHLHIYNTEHSPYNIHSHSPFIPRNPTFRSQFSFRNHVLRHKTRKNPPQVFAIFLAFPTFAVLSTEKKSKNFSGRKALCFSALSFSRNFFLKNNCEKIWWEWKKSVILHSLNGTSGTPLTTATAKSSLKEIT